MGKADLRLLYIINSFTWGGAEKLVYDLANGILEKVDFVGVVALYKQNSETETDMTTILRLNGVKTAILGKPVGKGRIRGILDIYQFAKNNHVNVIHGHCSVPMLFAKIVGNMLGIPVVCTIHNTKGYSKKKEMLTSWMVSKYISIGQATEDYMIKELNIDRHKVIRIYNAIEIDKYQKCEKKKEFWKQYGGSEGDFAILNVARIHEQKNQMCFAKAVNSCVKSGRKNVKAYILGYYDINDSVYEELHEYIVREGISQNFMFLGIHKNVADFLANADCFVMTSWYEGLSIAFLEAVISGVGIITTDMPFVRELNEIAPCAIVIPQNDDKALCKILSDGNFRRQSEETIQCFEQMFSMNMSIEKHFNIYQNILEHK